MDNRMNDIKEKQQQAKPIYILDKENNKLEELRACSFTKLNLTEREHLQEWIAGKPGVLGEELLIIQKEFNGFQDTKERLDLLALDKNGCLVIIENKLDDSGRDVTWQAIKYASYCASLTKDEIIDIFQRYLGPDKNAADVMSEFFDDRDIEEIDLNPENSQRIFFVAANFRKEVTSSVLWLSNFNIRIKCFKVTPYKYGDRIFIDFDQIIPIEDAEDYTIRMASKKQESSNTADTSIQRRNSRREFWVEFINYNKQHGGIFSNSTGSLDQWLNKSLGVSGISISVTINKRNTRVEVYINTGEREYNKEVYDYLSSHQNEIEQGLRNYPLKWLRKDDKDCCSISTSKDLSYINPNDKDDIFSYLTEVSKEFYKTFSPWVNKYKKQPSS